GDSDSRGVGRRPRVNCPASSHREFATGCGGRYSGTVPGGLGPRTSDRAYAAKPGAANRRTRTGRPRAGIQFRFVPPHRRRVRSGARMASVPDQRERSVEGRRPEPFGRRAPAFPAPDPGGRRNRGVHRSSDRGWIDAQKLCALARREAGLQPGANADAEFVPAARELSRSGSDEVVLRRGARTGLRLARSAFGGFRQRGAPGLRQRTRLRLLFYRRPAPGLYVAYQHVFLEFFIDAVTFVVRTAGEPHPLAASIPKTIQAVDPTLPVFDIHTMAEWVSFKVAHPRFNTWLLGSFSGIAL